MIKLKSSFGFLIALLLLSPLVSAFGITAPYWETKPLVMLPGESIDFALTLQNMDGTEDVVLKAELTGGAEIATLTDEKLEYLVPLGKKGIKVNLRAEIPEDTPLGKEYTIRVSFKEISTAEEGMVQMVGGIGKNIPVIVKSEEVLPEEEETPTPEEEKGFPTAMVVLLLVIVVILWYILFKKKK